MSDLTKAISAFTSAKDYLTSTKQDNFQSIKKLGLKALMAKRPPQPTNPIPDIQKPQFIINSLDKQNNDPMKGNLLDTFRGATDFKYLPGATFSGVTSKIPVMRN